MSVRVWGLEEVGPLACAGDHGGSMPARMPLHKVGSGKKVHRLVKGVSVWTGWRDLAGLTGAWALFWVLPCSLKEGSTRFRLCTRLAEVGASKGGFIRLVTAGHRLKERYTGNLCVAANFRTGPHPLT